jgi:hypothetical protein
MSQSSLLAPLSLVAPPKPAAIPHIMLVTPELAEEWLAINHVNRDLRKTNVDKFVRFIERGKFVMTGEGIQFEGFLNDENVRLVNGQHRLTAIVQTGKAQWMLVIEGIGTSTQMYMDTGSRRNFADVLKLERGVINAARVASSVRLGYLTDNEQFEVTGGGQREPGHDLLLEWFDAHPDVVEATKLGCRVRDQFQANAPAFAVAKMLFDRIDEEDSQSYFEDLFSGAGLPEGDPIIKLREYFIRAAVGRDRPRSTVQLAVACKAWNYRRTNRVVKSFLKWTYFGAAREPFPVPK